jgi:hypothetical protein
MIAMTHPGGNIFMVAIIHPGEHIFCRNYEEIHQMLGLDVFLFFRLTNLHTTSQYRYTRCIPDYTREEHQVICYARSLVRKLQFNNHVS